MLGVHEHAPHETSRSSAAGSCGRHRRSPLRPRSTHTPAMPSECDWRLALLASAVCLLARTPSRTLQRTRAHAAAHIHARACPCLHAQRRIRTHHLSHTTHLCARAHMHMHRARQTASHTQTGYHRKETPRHTHAHTYAHTYAHTHAHTVAYIHTYTHMNTHRHTKEHARAHTYTNVDTYRHTHKHLHTHMHMHMDTRRIRTQHLSHTLSV